MQSYAIPASASAVMARYGNIIFLERPVHDGDLFSRRHPAMTRLNRAKIFAPFAALVGFDERVRRKEVAYVPKVELDADEEWELNRRLMILHKRTANSRLARANAVAVHCVVYDDILFRALELMHCRAGDSLQVRVPLRNVPGHRMQKPGLGVVGCNNAHLAVGRCSQSNPHGNHCGQDVDSGLISSPSTDGHHSTQIHYTYRVILEWSTPRDELPLLPHP